MCIRDRSETKQNKQNKVKTRINNIRELERRPIKINKNKTKQELLRQIHKIIKNIEYSKKKNMNWYKKEKEIMYKASIQQVAKAK